MIELRCIKCNKLLMKGDFIEAKVEIDCQECKARNTFCFHFPSGKDNSFEDDFTKRIEFYFNFLN